MSRKLTCLALSVVVLALSMGPFASRARAELIGYWKLDETSGTVAADSAGADNDGILIGDQLGWTDGRSGGALSHGGVADARVEFPTMGMSATAGTVAMWGLLTDPQPAQTKYFFGHTTQPQWSNRIQLYTDDGNNLLDLGLGDSHNRQNDIVELPMEEWLHVALTWDSGVYVVYLNGEEVATGPYTGLTDVNEVANIGNDGSGAPYEAFAGLIDEVQLADHAMTELEIVAAMEGVEQVDMKIGFATQPPVIDGEVDYMWEGTSTQYFVPLDDPANASGSWQALYDSENLYVIVDVTDDSLQNDSASSWQDDSVELYFDGGNTKLDTPLSGDDHQYTFAWTTDEIQGTNIDGAIEGIEHAQVDTDTGWRIEIKLPWLSIQGAAPQAGDLIGIDCYYNDDDDGGDSREGKMLGFSAPVEGWNDASQWGTAVLAVVPEPVDPGVEGLVAYYAFENDANDSSGNGNDGTVVGATTFVEGPADYGMAMDFDGSSYVDCGNDASLDVLGPISVALWIKPGADDPEGQGTATAPLCKALSGASPSWSWQVRYGWNSPQPYMAFTFNTSPRAWAYVGKNLERDEWVHIGCSHDGTTLKCYLNGEETDSTPMGVITSSPAPLLIGSDGWRDDWIGAIDEVAIYDRGLSLGEIRHLAGHLPTPVDPGTENLTAYYTLDNDANDASGNDNHGTPSGDPQWVDGVIGGALEFDGVDDHVDCGNDPSLDITGPITIAAWVYPTGNGSSNYPRIVDKSNGTGGADPGYKMYLRAADNYVVTLSAGGTYLNSSLAADLNAWNHVVFITDGTQRKLCLNGAWEEWDESALPSSSSNPLFIGNSPAGARHFQGTIDEVEIYNRALSKPEVRFIAGDR